MTHKSPDLELVSNKASDQSSGGGASHPDTPVTRNGAERRRLPRLNLTAEQFKDSRSGKVYSVTDLSKDGMALRLLDKQEVERFPIGELIEGALNLRRVKYAIKARVRHLGNCLVGCQFEDLSEQVQTVLKNTLDPRELGKDLKPLPINDGGVLWYHGTSGVDFILWRETDGQFVRLTAYIFGAYVQWDEKQGLETGVVHSLDAPSEDAGVVRFDSLDMKADESPDLQKISMVREMLETASLPNDLKTWCLRHIQQN